MPPALDGVRVLEVASYVAGPYAANLLAEMGADVIKVESPAGDPMRGTSDFLVLNRSKRGIAVDLHREDGREVVRALAEKADVLIESFRPTTMKRWGLTHEDLRHANPGLVYCSISGFGSRGPYRDKVGYDPLVAARAAILSDQGGDARPPVYITLPIASYGAALMAACGIGAALYDRELRGRGQWLEVPLLNGALAMQTGMFLAGEGFERISPGNPLGAVAAYRLYECADGWIFIACGNQTFWQRLCLALEITEYLIDPRYENAPWNVLREDQAELAESIAAIIRTKPRAHWLDYLAQNDIPCAPVSRSEDFMSDPQVLANEMCLEVQDPSVGATRQIGIPVKLLKTPGTLKGPAPLLGQHTEEVLTELGLGEKRIVTLARAGVIRRAKQGVAQANPVSGTWAAARQERPVRTESRQHPLQGVRVVDFGAYIAGAYGPSLLADLGAEVIKVEPLQGEAFRTMLAAFQGWNRGKRSLAVDLGKEEGREIVYRLVRRADVVVENFRRGTAEKLGVGYETLSQMNPRLIYCAMAGHGETGPRAKDPGFDPLFQARGGAMAAQGGAGQPPVYLRIAISDYAAAMLSAFGVGLALYARERSGLGQRIELSLTNSTMAVQAGRFIFYEGKPAQPAGGPDLKGVSATYRLYEAAGGWLFLLCPDESAWRSLCRCLGRPDLITDARFSSATQRLGNDAPLAEILASLIRRRGLSELLRALEAEGVPCAPVITNSEVLTDPHVLENELIVSHDHPGLGTLQQVGLTVKMRETPGKLWGPAPMLGQHTDAVLAEHGYTAEQIARLREKRVVD